MVPAFWSFYVPSMNPFYFLPLELIYNPSEFWLDQFNKPLCLSSTSFELWLDQFNKPLSLRLSAPPPLYMQKLLRLLLGHNSVSICEKEPQFNWSQYYDETVTYVWHKILVTIPYYKCHLYIYVFLLSYSNSVLNIFHITLIMIQIC